MYQLKGLSGKEYNAKCHKCKQVPKFGIKIEGKYQCQDENLCKTIAELSEILNENQEDELSSEKEIKDKGERLMNCM
jgi:hypothetical protein